MRALILFLPVFAGALFCGALLTYPLYLIASLFTDPQFTDLVILSTQLCGLVFSLGYLHYTVSLNRQTIGLAADGKAWLSGTGRGFLAGIIIMVLLTLGLLVPGIYGFHSSREISTAIIMRLLAGALFTGFAVALFEETVFRGALQQGLAKTAGTPAALLTVSLIYAAVHFIDYREAETIGWLTAPQQFLTAYSSLLTADNLDAFLCLFVLGLLLGLVRIRTGNIIQCIGLHAGLVAGVKLFRFFFEYHPANEYNYLVSSHDLRLGYLALILLSLVTITYYFKADARVR